MSTSFHSPAHVEPQLQPILSAKYALSWQQAVVVAVFAATFLLASHFPLGVHRTWSHSVQGRWILENGVLPHSIPQAEFSHGMPYVPTSWLSDVTIGWIATCGLSAVAAVIAVMTLAAMLMWYRLFVQVSNRRRVGLALSMVLLVYWSFGLGALRGEILAAWLLPALLMTVWNELPIHPIAVHRATSRIRMVLFAAIFLLWANLSVSHLVGVGIVVLATVAVMVRQWTATRSVRAVVTFKPLQRWVLLTELAVLMSLLTPHGFDLWKNILRGDPHGPIWRFVGPSYGLNLASTSGVLFGVLVIALTLCWAWGKRPTLLEALTLIALSCLTAVNVSAIFWFAPMIMLFIAQHCRSTNRSNPKLAATVADDGKPVRFGWSLLTLLFVWYAFAFSPFADFVMDSKSQSANQQLDRTVPITASRFLRESPGEGVVFAPSDWSDWLAWDGPPGMRLMVNEQLGIFPDRVQRDYWQLFQGEADWERLADRYRIGTMVIDKSRQARIAAEVARARGGWKIALETSTILVVQRSFPSTSHPIIANGSSSASRANSHSANSATATLKKGQS